MPTYRLVESTGVFSRVFRNIKMCFLNVLRLHVSQSQRQKRLYRQYMEQLTGAYLERCADMGNWDHRYNHKLPSPDWKYPLPCEDHWCCTDGSCCDSECSECSDSGRCSSPCCSEVIFNGGFHFGERPPYFHACNRYPVCCPGNFRWVFWKKSLSNLLSM